MRIFYGFSLAMIVLISPFCLAQGMSPNIGLSQSSPSSVNLRGGNFSLEDKLNEMEKKRTNIEKLASYVPLDGAVDADGYIVGPGDQFTISISGGVEEQYPIAVGADGWIVLPYTSAVEVAGQTLAEAKAKITSALGEVFKENDLTVSLTATRLFIVDVVGMVNIPGDQTVSAVQRVYSAIELAGGKLSNADISRVELIRHGEKRILDLTRYLSDGDLSQNPYLLDGDIVVVPRVDISKPVVFLSGAGCSGAVVNIDPDERIGELMRRVGVDREVIDLTDIALIRDGEGYSLSLLDKSADVPILAGDSIFFKALPDSVYVGGRVVGGGSTPYVAGMSYLNYIAMAGGVAHEGSVKAVKIIRNGEELSPRKAGAIRRGDAIIVGESTWYVVTETLKSLSGAASFATAVYVIGFRD